jgi:hypothetical protein
MQRRVQGRVPLPWIQVDPEWLAAAGGGRPLVRFADIPLEWSDFRLTFRQTADILQRFEALERADYDKIVALGRDGNALEPLVSRGTSAVGRRAGQRPRHARRGRPAGLDQVLVLALRPFLARCAESLHAAGRSGELEPRALPDLRLGAGLRGDHAERRPPAVLRALRRAVELRAAHLPVLRQRRPRADHVVRDARRPLSRLRVRRLPALSEGVRRARTRSGRDGGVASMRRCRWTRRRCNGDIGIEERTEKPRRRKEREKRFLASLRGLRGFLI